MTGEIVAATAEYHGLKVVLPGTVTPLTYAPPEGLSYEEWQTIGVLLRGIERGIQWWIGDWLRYGERRFSEAYAQVGDMTDLSHGTLANLKYVAGRFEPSRRRETLPWSHHAEVASRQDADEILDVAEREGWSKRDVRTEVERRKTAEAAPIPKRSWKVVLHAPDEIAHGGLPPGMLCRISLYDERQPQLDLLTIGRMQVENVERSDGETRYTLRQVAGESS
jgi:hypothetical protein